MTRIHEQMYLEFNQQNKNSTQTYNIMWQLLWLNMTPGQHGLSDLHYIFVFILINILEENLYLKVQHKNIMNEKR